MWIDPNCTSYISLITADNMNGPLTYSKKDFRIQIKWDSCSIKSLLITSNKKYGKSWFSTSDLY